MSSRGELIGELIGEAAGRLKIAGPALLPAALPTGPAAPVPRAKLPVTAWAKQIPGKGVKILHPADRWPGMIGTSGRP